jgi:aminoglycoside 3-N-acetyltransferase
VQGSPSTSGIFTEMIRQHPLAIRSLDPIFSVTGIGEKASILLNNVGEECFGVESFWDRFYLADGKFVNMNMDTGNTFIHYVERTLNVPYRFNKTFHGVIKNGTELYESKAIYFVRDLNKPHDEPDFRKFDTGFRKSHEFVKSTKIGRGIILSFQSRDVFSFIKKNLSDDSKYLLKGTI